MRVDGEHLSILTLRFEPDCEKHFIDIAASVACRLGRGHPHPYAGRRPPGSARALRNKCPVHSPAVLRRRLLQVGHRWRARREEHIEVFARDFQTCVATTELGG